MRNDRLYRILEALLDWWGTPLRCKVGRHNAWPDTFDARFDRCIRVGCGKRWRVA